MYKQKNTQTQIVVLSAFSYRLITGFCLSGAGFPNRYSWFGELRLGVLPKQPSKPTQVPKQLQIIKKTSRHRYQNFRS
jgi:hypothetical protein